MENYKPVPFDTSGSCILVVASARVEEDPRLGGQLSTSGKVAISAWCSQFGKVFSE